MQSAYSTETTRSVAHLPPDEAIDLPMPFGWFAVAYSADLKTGDVMPLYLFDEHLVLFRTADAKAHVTTAFCPHLGAHLGHGGKVEGNALVCPFHGWRFDGDGVCVDIPYAKVMPRRAASGPCLFSYPVRERNRMIWAWHHPRRLPPMFELDEIPELSDPSWSDPECFEWEVAAAIQEAGENAVDIAHFVTVHGAQEMPQATITLDGHRRDTRMTVIMPVVDQDGNVDLMRTAPVDLVTKNCGPGMSTQEFSLGAKTVMLGTVTPITAKRMKLRFAFTKPKDIAGQFEMLINALTAEIARQVEQDIPIWEHKICRPTPILCDGDGPIAKYRRWFSQFYAEGQHSSEAAIPQALRQPASTAVAGVARVVRELRSSFDRLVGAMAKLPARMYPIPLPARPRTGPAASARRRRWSRASPRQSDC